MSYKKARTSLFICTALCGVSLLAQTYVLRAAELEEVKTVVVSAVEEVVVDPAKLALAEAPEVDEVISIKKFLKTVESGANPEVLETNLNSIIRSIVGSPIPTTEYSASLGLEIIRLVQKTESLRVFDRTVEPHASDYYMLLPESLTEAHQNLKYYQWLSQVVYTVQTCLRNRGSDTLALAVGYRAYLKDSPKGYDWLYSSPAYFENILKFLERDESQTNPYFSLTPLYDENVAKLNDELADRLKINGEFVAFSTKASADTLLCAMEIPYEDGIRIITDATHDKRIYRKDAEYYENIIRRRFAVQGEQYMVDMLNIYEDALKRTPGNNALSMFASFLKGMGFVISTDEANIQLKKELRQAKADYCKKAPYLAAIGDEPEAETERAIWNERLGEWKETNKSIFDEWEVERITFERKCESEYSDKYFSLLYNNILSKIDLSTENIIQFVNGDFARLFKDNFVETNPVDRTQTVPYINLLLKLKGFNLFHWRPTSDLECASDWNYTILPTLLDINVMRTIDEEGHVRYLRLIRTSDTAGLMKAIRDESALGLPKLTTLTVNSSPVISVVEGEL